MNQSVLSIDQLGIYTSRGVPQESTDEGRGTRTGHRRPHRGRDATLRTQASVRRFGQNNLFLTLVKKLL